LGTFKHHSYFPKEKAWQSYLLPNVCFVCRKCFKKPATPQASTCPNCGGKMVSLNRKFSAPKSNDLAQWTKVQFLVSKGFLFQSIYEVKNENGEYAGHYKVSYPKTLEEAVEFVVKFKDQAEQTNI
jgi:hypothetical protein